MFSASAGGILIQFLFMPLLSRVYDPGAYGLFGIFNTALVILGSASMLGYNHALVLPKTERAFRALLAVTLRAGLIGSVIAAVLVVVFAPFLKSWEVTAGLGNWIYALGPLMLLLILDRVMLDWSIREKAFKSQSFWAIPITLVSKGFNLGYGYFVSATADGHIITTAINYLLRAWVYAGRIIPNGWKRLKARSSREERIAVRREYKDYPGFTMWANLLNTGSNLLPIVLLPILLLDVDLAAHYSFALLVLDLPLRLMASGISPVYIQKAAEVSEERPHELGPLTFRLFRNLVAAAAISMALIYALGSWAYPWVFGEEWKLAGQAAEVLSIYYFFRLISSPISPVINILREEGRLFTFQLVLFIVRVGSLIGAYFWSRDFLEIMLVFSIANALTFAVLTQRIFAIIRYRAWSAILMATGAFAVCLLLAHLAKSAF